MTASYTPRLPTPALDGYSNFVSRISASSPFPQVVSASALVAALNRSLGSSQLLDQVKKGLFYGKAGTRLQALHHSLDPDLPGLSYPPEDPSLGLIHGVLGLRTEVDELIELLLAYLIDDVRVPEKWIDEAGDVTWYLQRLIQAVEQTFAAAGQVDLERVVEANVAKLSKRFPRGFDAAYAQAPDKAAEAEAQAVHPRDRDQAEVAAWITDRISPSNATNLMERAMRLAEEAIEAAQVVGVQPYSLHRLVDKVMAKPVGEIGQELGGVSTTHLAFCEAAGLSAHEVEQTELARMRTLTREHMQARHQAKVEAGVAAA